MIKRLMPPSFQKRGQKVLWKQSQHNKAFGSKANITGPLAPTSTVKRPVLEVISVLTKPGQISIYEETWV